MIMSLRTVRSKIAPVFHRLDRTVLFAGITALYLSRASAEFLLPSQPGLGAILGAVAGGGLGWIVSTRTASVRWVLLLLLPALLLPTQSPEVTLLAGIAAAVAWAATRPRLPGWVAEAAVFAAALALFTLTLAPGLQPADAGEFQLILNTWGVAHPPGYALYTVLGGLFAHLMPLGSPADRVNLFSALCGALTLAILTRAIRQETGSAWAGIISAGILGAAVSFWTTATQASIRPMTALFTAAMLLAVLAYRRAAREDDPGRSRTALIGFGAAAALGITHHASLVFVAVCFAAAILIHRPALLRQPRLWLPGLASALVGVLPWLYLLIRAGSGGRLTPAGLATWDGFSAHVLARGFSGDMFYYRSLPEVADRLQATTQVYLFQWAWPVQALAGLAAIRLAWRDRWLLLALGLPFAVHTLVAATYKAPQTVEYLIPAYVLLAASIGWMVGSLPPRLCGFGLRPLAVGGLAALIAGSAWPTWVSLRAYQRADPTEDAARALLDNAPPDSTILANWHQSTPLWFLQDVEHARPDVTVRYVAPAGAEPILDTWTRLIQEGAGQGPLITCAFYPDQFRQLDLAFSALAGCWEVHAAGVNLAASPALAELPALALVGFAETESLTAGATAPVDLTWNVESSLAIGEITTFVHLVDGANQVVGQDDRPLMTASGFTGEFVQRHRITLPRTLPPGTYTLLAGAYRVSPSGIQPLSDSTGQARFPVAALRVEASDLPPVTGHALHTPFGSDLTLLGYDYDLSVPGRARLILHWQTSGALDTIRLLIAEDDILLADHQQAANSPGFLDTAHDLPDTATLGGVRLTVQTQGEALPVLGPWNFVVGNSLWLPAPQPGERYVPVGAAILTRSETQATPTESGIEWQVHLTLRSQTAQTADLSFSLAANGFQLDGTPVDGMLPSLKWGWSATVHDSLRLAVPSSVGDDPPILTLYDAFTGDVWPVLDPALNQAGPGLRLSPP